MPWTVADVEKFKKGLSEKDKEKWVKIANNALRQCTEKGGEELDCEVQAVRIANGSFSEKKGGVLLSERPNPLRPANRKEELHLAFAEADTEGEYQLAFPVGLFNTGGYGEVIVTRTFAERMAANWSRLQAAGRNVYMDTEHDFGEANAWAEDIKADEEGIKVKWSFNERGRQLIEDKRFRYYSAAIGWGLDIESGEELYPVLHAVSLTNRPVMYTMPEAHLSEGVIKNGNSSDENISAHGDGEKNNKGDAMETLQEVIKALFALPDEEKGKLDEGQRQKLAELAGVEQNFAAELKLRDEKITLLEKQNREYAEQLKKINEERHNTRKAEVIEKALAEGKITPKSKALYEQMFDKDAEWCEKLLSEKGPEVDLEARGTGAGGGEGAIQLSEEEKKLGLSEEDLKEYGGDE